jgi:thiol-disulfide isomerase/thioredoxin
LNPVRLILTTLALWAWSVASAAPLEIQKTWISPQAQVVIDRAKTAYAGLEGWSASLVFEDHQIANASEKVWMSKSAERYLRGDGPMGCYACISHDDIEHEGDDRPKHVVLQSNDASYSMHRALTGKLYLSASVPEEYNAPQLWVAFQLDLTHTQYVRYAGRELVGGQACDIVETSSVRVATATPGQPGQPPSMGSTRYYFTPDGFVVRMITVRDEFAGPEPAAGGAKARPLTARWSELRITEYDAKAKLNPGEFTREAFERAAATVLKPGEVMPTMDEQLFRRGERLPEVSFIAWADKQPFRISDLQGKVVVVETWASWCHFCKEAFPYYEKMRQQLATQDVVFVAVSFDAKVADYEMWMNAHADGYGFKFGRIDAPDAKAALKEFRGALPSFYVLGRDGKILSSYMGYGYGSGGEDPRLLAALREAGVKL